MVLRCFNMVSRCFNMVLRWFNMALRCFNMVLRIFDMVLRCLNMVLWIFDMVLRCFNMVLRYSCIILSSLLTPLLIKSNFKPKSLRSPTSPHPVPGPEPGCDRAQRARPQLELDSPLWCMGFNWI